MSKDIKNEDRWTGNQAILTIKSRLKSIVNSILMRLTKALTRIFCLKDSYERKNTQNRYFA
ncbi:MAG: hypothetical protein LBG67_01675 [Campylobacteraceae bacterium]|nr:hypothetical protein [Campylobacteraceae bacterium]